MVYETYIRNSFAKQKEPNIVPPKVPERTPVPTPPQRPNQVPYHGPERRPLPTRKQETPRPIKQNP